MDKLAGPSAINHFLRARAVETQKVVNLSVFVKTGQSRVEDTKHGHKCIERTSTSHGMIGERSTMVDCKSVGREFFER
jgi:hypothetical protein